MFKKLLNAVKGFFQEEPEPQQLAEGIATGAINILHENRLHKSDIRFAANQMGVSEDHYQLFEDHFICWLAAILFEKLQSVFWPPRRMFAKRFNICPLVHLNPSHPDWSIWPKDEPGPKAIDFVRQFFLEMVFDEEISPLRLNERKDNKYVFFQSVCTLKMCQRSNVNAWEGYALFCELAFNNEHFRASRGHIPFVKEHLVVQANHDRSNKLVMQEWSKPDIAKSVLLVGKSDLQYSNKHTEISLKYVEALQESGNPPTSKYEFLKENFEQYDSLMDDVLGKIKRKYRL